MTWAEIAVLYFTALGMCVCTWMIFRPSTIEIRRRGWLILMTWGLLSELADMALDFREWL